MAARLFSLVAGLALAAAAPGPEQLSLAVTEAGPSEMFVTWASKIAYAPGAAGAVTYGPAATFPAGAASAPAETHSYSAGLGWTGTLFGARMTGLAPGARYAYTVTDAAGNASAPRAFHAAPAPAPDGAARIGVLADMGTIQLMGWDVAAEVIKAHAADPFDAFMIAGDLSYATVNPPNGVEFQEEWDAWVNQNEPFASTAPFMMTVGNHEGTPGHLINATGTFPLDFAAYSARFRMPRNGPADNNFLYSWSYGPAFFISADSEHDFSAGSAQVAWIEAALAGVDRSVYPWLFFSLHHPIISSDSDEVGDHTPGGEKAAVFSPLFKKYAVDVVFQGHQHNYGACVVTTVVRGAVPQSRPCRCAGCAPRVAQSRSRRP